MEMQRRHRQRAQNARRDEEELELQRRLPVGSIEDGQLALDRSGNAVVRLDELKQKALRDYDTDDLEKLKLKLEELKDENKRRRSEYQTQLERIESDLREVNERYAQAQKDEESRR